MRPLHVVPRLLLRSSAHVVVCTKDSDQNGYRDEIVSASWLTHFQPIQFFVSLLVSTLSQKEHWIDIRSDARKGGVIAMLEKGGYVWGGGWAVVTNYISPVAVSLSDIILGNRFTKPSSKHFDSRYQ